MPTRRGFDLHQHRRGGRTALRRNEIEFEQLYERVGLLLSALEILPLEPPVDQRYAEVRHHLATQGTPIGPNDLLIAAHALAADLILVTANTREFERVPSLRVENWLLE